MITYLLEINIIAYLNCSQGNILQLIGGEAYDILPPPPFRLCWFLISLMEKQYIDMDGIQTKCNLKHVSTAYKLIQYLYLVNIDAKNSR